MAALGFVACFFFFQAEDGIRDKLVTGVQTCALPIYRRRPRHARGGGPRARFAAAPRGRGRPRAGARAPARAGGGRSEEHTSELQSLAYLVCRLLLEKKKKKDTGVMVNGRSFNMTTHS